MLTTPEILIKKYNLPEKMSFFDFELWYQLNSTIEQFKKEKIPVRDVDLNDRFILIAKYN